MNIKLIGALTICFLAASPAHFCLLAEERLSADVEVNTSDAQKNPSNLDIPPELITMKLRKRNPAFSISMETVLRKLKKKEEIILVDVRSREAFERFRVPGSINLPLFALKTKAFLKSKPLVLINDGWHQKSQGAGCCIWSQEEAEQRWCCNATAKTG